MKAIYLNVFILFLAAVTILAQGKKLSVCAESSNDSGSPKNLIMTVCNHTHGMAPLIQPRLYFRLFSDGRAEFEVSRPYSESASYIDELLMKEMKVDKQDIKAISKLIGQDDFKNAKPEYPRFQSWDDSSLETTIIVRLEDREKRIIVKNYSTWDKDNKTHYPASLLALLEKIDQLREK